MQMDFVPYGIYKEIFGKKKISKTLYGRSKNSVEVRKEKNVVTGEEVLLEDRNRRLILVRQRHACRNNGEAASILLDFGVSFTDM